MILSLLRLAKFLSRLGASDRKSASGSGRRAYCGQGRFLSHLADIDADCSEGRLGFDPKDYKATATAGAINYSFMECPFDWPQD